VTGPDDTRRSADRGSATLWTVAVALVIMLSTAAVLLIAIAVSARHRAATAADLSALAAASVLASAQVAGITTSSTEQACQAARDIADANGARLSDCQVNGSMVDVLTTVNVPAVGYLGEHSVSAHARAGPS
jgi:secretion/DNA translocation related TadE-like protein